MKRKHLLIVLLIVIFLQGCASSGSTRGAASEADKVYLDSDYAFSHPNGSVRDAIQNSNQTTKGILLGGLIGAISGSIYSSSIGFLPGLAGGAIIGGAIGAYVDDYATLQDRLINRGANIIILGDQLKVIYPSNILFEDYSAAIRPEAYATLHQTAVFISQYPNTSVTVAAYTSATGPAVIDQTLSQQQAEAIVHYLWKTGINTRLLYATGQGGTHLISKNSPDWSSENYRIEISLEKLPTEGSGKI